MGRLQRFTPIQTLILGFVVGLLVALALALLRQERGQGDLVLRVEPLETPADITVYVDGAVAKPGLYTLPTGSRLADALDRAGLLPSADTSRLPLAERLRDGQSIVVPERQAQVAEGTTATAPAQPGSTLIDINAASADELETLPGIGPALAERIVAYRTEHGPFQSVDELARVRGISPRMVDELRDLVTVGGVP
ncbi:ComEA family DNA-binding protein [Thermomicrobiaceae bacterium CFH 74404]|uniref:ComEA family DNA-binding protein n=1 Tax=Thermalbibacter longus TaxID=2951981 RepID=A0AA41W9L6_9BACT|nr:ComEA family DNA-binding protein [Thermalbibacter longus]MCM8748324.1 ComEA family DNA-binding protein [Thermalbibacter longus]